MPRTSTPRREARDVARPSSLVVRPTWGGRPDAAVGCYYPTRDDSVYFDCGATTEGKLRICYCDDGLPQWLKRKKSDNKGKVGDEKHKVQLRHGALQPEKVLWGDSRGARRRRD